MSTARKSDRNGWVREGLAAKGYSQRDLARAWGVAEPSVSRFISGEEGADPPLSRAVTLAVMLGITLEDVARGLGLRGKRIEPAVSRDVDTPSVGTFRMDVLEEGRVRVVLCQDVAPDVASQLISVLGGGARDGRRLGNRKARA
jgi:plasmid maintenance system antidote protein VapI